jgi:hypothetical protein
MLERKRRDIPMERFFPQGWETTAAAAPEPNLFPGEHLLLTREYFQAAIRIGPELVQRASAVLMIDMKTGFILAANPAPDVQALGAEAASVVFGSHAFSFGRLRPPKKLLVACDLPARTSTQFRCASDGVGVDIEHPQRRHIRRWTALRLWAFERLPLVPPPSRRAQSAPPDWPIMSEAEFECVLADAVNRDRIDRERILDERDEGGSEGGEEYARILKLLFRKGKEN